MHPKALLDACAELVGLTLRLEHPADSVVSRYFRDHRQLGPRERATLADLARGSRIAFAPSYTCPMVADYCAGQYYPVEYRPAAVRLIRDAWWQAVAGRLAEADADDIRKLARRTFGAGITRRWFS